MVDLCGAEERDGLFGNVLAVFSVAIEMNYSRLGVVPDTAVALFGNAVHYFRDYLQVVTFS